MNAHLVPAFVVAMLAVGALAHRLWLLARARRWAGLMSWLRRHADAFAAGLTLALPVLAMLWWFIVCEPCLRYAWAVAGGGK